MTQDTSFSHDLSPDVAAALAGQGAGLAELGVQLRETALVGIESVTGQRAVLRDVALGVTDPASIEAEFGALDHVAFEVRLASLPAMLLVSLADLDVLIAPSAPPEAMADPAVATARTEAVAAAMRQFLDLISVALGGDAMSGVEAVLAGQRIGQAGETAAILAEAARGRPLLRVDLVLESAGGEVTVALLAPAVLVDALVGDGGLSSEAFGFADNISPLRPPARDDVDVHPVRFPPLPEGRVAPPPSPSAFDLIMDVSMRVTVELGRSSMTVEEILSLGPGSVVELDKLAGEPVDVLVNDQLIARGEVVVVDENFGVRVTEIVSPRHRAQAMGA